MKDKKITFLYADSGISPHPAHIEWAKAIGIPENRMFGTIMPKWYNPLSWILWIRGTIVRQGIRKSVRRKARENENN